MDTQMIIFGTKEIGFYKTVLPSQKSSAKIYLDPVEADKVSSSLSPHHPLRQPQEECISHF